MGSLYPLELKVYRFMRAGCPRSSPIPFDKPQPMPLGGRTLLMKGTFKNCSVAHCAAMRLSIWRISRGNVEETF